MTRETREQHKQQRRQQLAAEHQATLARIGQAAGPPDAATVRVPLTAGQHILHLLLTVFTGGLWAIVWIIRAGQGNRAPLPPPMPQWQPQSPQDARR